MSDINLSLPFFLGASLFTLAFAKARRVLEDNIVDDAELFGPNVLLFDANDDSDEINERIHAECGEMCSIRSHFSEKRKVVLFKPGNYKNINIDIGYYMQVSGLGRNANDVSFSYDAKYTYRDSVFDDIQTQYESPSKKKGKRSRYAGIHARAADPGGSGSLDTFWRSLENVTLDNDLLFAVSQAAPIRRVEVHGDVLLHERGLWASGGFMANSKVLGLVDIGSQQQWCFRNCHFSSSTDTDSTTTVIEHSSLHASEILSPSMHKGSKHIERSNVKPDRYTKNSTTGGYMAHKTPPRYQQSTKASHASQYKMQGLSPPNSYVKPSPNGSVLNTPTRNSNGNVSDNDNRGNTPLLAKVPPPTPPDPRQHINFNTYSYSGKYGVSGGAWNVCYFGCRNGEATNYRSIGKERAVTAHKYTTIMCEKPFISYHDNQYYLEVPLYQKNNNGCSLDYSVDRYASLSFKRNVYVAKDNEDVSLIQKNLDGGKHIVLTPGQYLLDNALVVKYHGQIILGLGFATLIAGPSGKCIYVLSGLKQVRLAGIMLQAGLLGRKTFYNETCLLQWGDKNSGSSVPDLDDAPIARGYSMQCVFLENEGTSTKPASPSINQRAVYHNNVESIDVAGSLHDCFVRVGGPLLSASQRAKHPSGRSIDCCVHTMVQINVSNVIGDHLWLWGADHSSLLPGEQPYKGEKYHLTKIRENDVDVGLHVNCNANNVIMYGLQVEHTLQHHVLWEGEYGSTHFYQCELPYHINKEHDKRHTSQLTGYRVVNVLHHIVDGAGVYCYFRFYRNVMIPAAFVIESKEEKEKKIENIYSENISKRKENTPSKSPPSLPFPLSVRNEKGKRGTQPSVVFTNAFTRFLNGNGEIKTVLIHQTVGVHEKHGRAVNEKHKMAYVNNNII